MKLAEVKLTPKGERWARSGHPWVYLDDLDRPDAALSGEIVPVKGPQGKPLGLGFFNAKSKIGLRWIAQNPEQPINRDFWAGRLDQALKLRERVVQDSNACRLISSEADGFPGLIVDRYGPVLVLQSLCLGMEKILPVLIELLKERTQAVSIVSRNESHVRALEGLPLEKKLLFGPRPERVEIREGECRFLVDVWEGQKTGFYLDQRENRLRAREFARGRVLDVFAYQGGFALQVASRAQEVLAIEDSEAALSHLKENLSLNGITNVRAERGNAFDRLRELEKNGEAFDLVILDPPAFAKSKQEIQDAWRGYREINLRAMKILKPDGVLFTCSCSYNITDDIFTQILREAGRDAQRPARLVEIRTQSRDHPILLTHPESKYLKCLVLEVQ